MSALSGDINKSPPIPIISGIVIAVGNETDLWQRILFLTACVTLPIVWGLIVNWLFNLWMQSSAEADEDRIFPDYQI